MTAESMAEDIGSIQGGQWAVEALGIPATWDTTRTAIDPRAHRHETRSFCHTNVIADDGANELIQIRSSVFMIFLAATSV